MSLQGKSREPAAESGDGAGRRKQQNATPAEKQVFKEEEGAFPGLATKKVPLGDSKASAGEGGAWAAGAFSKKFASQSEVPAAAATAKTLGPGAGEPQPQAQKRDESEGDILFGAPPSAPAPAPASSESSSSQKTRPVDLGALLAGTAAPRYPTEEVGFIRQLSCSTLRSLALLSQVACRRQHRMQRGLNNRRHHSRAR